MTTWVPPSELLFQCEGIWRPRSVSKVSYPDDGNEACYQVEEDSYWFHHRNACILEALQKFPPTGTLYDIGGGNGFVALGMQKAGFDVVLVEPGSGAMNAAKRGLQRVIWATLDDAGLHDGAVPAAAAFDVVEHIEDDISFVKTIRRTLKPGGRFYCTVPASGFLWSGEDTRAGHFRRYNRATLADVMGAAGFEVEFISSFFSWLTVPVFFLRALPWRLAEGGRGKGEEGG
ncbi:MAG: class I SAM-dependent methyltransferase [Verrucomicrobiaceae bacterium]|nr:class I SAM-dependent methyltransferase [Verrucomicrobiaceae bacterium]